MRFFTSITSLANLCFFLLILSGCSQNPVTGAKEFLLPSQASDNQIGASQYLPAQQSQGGAYDLDPKLTAYISAVGKKLAAASDQPNLPYEFVVLNNPVPNAWALPGGKIAINRGLLLQLKDEAQLAAVLGHEVVHSAARHGAQQMRNQQLMQLGLAGLGLALSDNDYRGMVIGGAALGAQLTSARYGRENELESDEYGMKYMAKAGYDLHAAVELQELFFNLAKRQESSWLEGLFATHPPSSERIRKNQIHAQRLVTETRFRGEEDYAEATRYMREKAPAYEFAQQAAEAYKSKRYSEAEKLIKQALEIEPKEAQFHSLAGVIYQAQGKTEVAVNSHNQAIKLNPQLFSSYLKRGETFAAQGKLGLAKTDFETSMLLLPTSKAQSYLQQINQTGR